MKTMREMLADAGQSGGSGNSGSRCSGCRRIALSVHDLFSPFNDITL
jgi:hypothetical protein